MSGRTAARVVILPWRERSAATKPGRSTRQRAARRLCALVGAVLVAASTAALAAPEPVRAQPAKPKGSLMLIMDASGSMKAEDDAGVPLIKSAKQALGQVVEALPEGAPVGLTVYGNTVSNDAPKRKGCKDVNVVVPVSPLDKQRMKARIAGIEASGYTPIGRALRVAARELPAEGPRTIILVSDGKDTCAPPPPCQVAQDLINQGIDVKVETVGFFLQGQQKARKQLKCIAKATGGSYHNAESAEELAEKLQKLSTRAMRTYETQGKRVTGGASYQEAPILGEGTYRDTILANEQLWYGVELAKGQELIVRSTLVISNSDFGYGALGGLYEVQIVDPNLEAMNFEGRGYELQPEANQQTINVSARSGVVGAEESNAERPGTYYIRITTASDDADGELPMEFTIEITGNDASSSPSASPSTSKSAVAAAPPADGNKTASGGGSVLVPALSALSGFLGLAVIGLTIALVTVLRQQRRRVRFY